MMLATPGKQRYSILRLDGCQGRALVELTTKQFCDRMDLAD
jgi:hypothetical protein